MITEYIRYTVPAEIKDDFIKGYTRAVESLKASSHCRGYELHQGNEEPENFILRIQWDSLDGHMHGFRNSPEFQPFFQAIGPFYKYIQEMKHYNLTALAWNRA